jgi:hypothetical protein
VSEFDRVAFVTSACDPDSHRTFLHRPARVGGWIVGTDGSSLLAIPYESGDVFPTESVLTANVPKMLRLPGEWPKAVLSVDALREAAGPAETPCGCDPGQTRPCVRCHGAKQTPCMCPCCEHEHDAPCEECAGTGVQNGCDKCADKGVIDHHALDRRATLFGVPINLRRVARLLRLAPSGKVNVHHDGDPVHSFVFDGEDWRGVLMPLRETGDPLPRLEDMLPAEATP